MGQLKVQAWLTKGCLSKLERSFRSIGSVQGLRPGSGFYFGLGDSAFRSSGHVMGVSNAGRRIQKWILLVFRKAGHTRSFDTEDKGGDLSNVPRTYGV